MRASALLVAALVGMPVAASDLGTLFHSREERAALERQRRGERAEGPGAEAPKPPDPVITGYVKRSDGRSTAFVDGRPVPVRGEALNRRLEPRVVERPEPVAAPPAR